MASNENLLGPSPRARQAILDNIDEISSYPDSSCRDLRAAIGARLDVDPDNLFVGNGAVEIIYALCQAFLERSDQVITGTPSFSAYTIGSQIQDARVIAVPLVEDRFDVDGLRAAVTDETKIVFVANPNNPTGSIIGIADIARLLKFLPASVILLLDEAYAEFVADPSYHGSIDLVGAHPNLVILRTLSKSMGIAGLRVGYCVASKPVINTLIQVQVPFHVNVLAQKAALAALDDDDHMAKTLAYLQEGKDYLYRELHRLRVSFVETHTNFLWIRTDVPADDLFQRLVAAGCIVRPGTGFGCPFHCRVTIGLAWHNERFIKALEHSLAD